VRLVSNRWRRWTFTLLAPVYDALVLPLAGMRERSFALAALSPGERVLLVGVGTGADFPFLPVGVRAVATDLTPAMLQRAPRREGVHLALMDGLRLALPAEGFDAVVLHLIVAVAPDPAGCLGEAARVVRPGGRIAVIDKFKPRGGKAPLALRLFRPLIRLLGTDVALDLDALAARAGLVIEHREPGAVKGLFQVALLRKPGARTN
jgi:ubiquinone/menaquinone biosynthesis C-methylase UbiE